jgi:hypothetical protein
MCNLALATSKIRSNISLGRSMMDERRLLELLWPPASGLLKTFISENRI